MNNLNSILIEGNLVKDPLLRSTQRGTQVCTMRLASNRYFKQETGYEKEVSFFNVESWSRLAESCYNKGKKGRGVRVVGRLKEDRWTGADGKPLSRVTIVAEHIEFRPEFKKDAKLAEEAAENPPSLYTGEHVEDDFEAGVVAIAEKELETVPF
ncbi:MAG: single-stranded DNA-binding protein [Treponema sp.]|jgi:single-strand DNA-binding protein|nr:single-stranded DNA-binding protein [Treponema sp.]